MCCCCQPIPLTDVRGVRLSSRIVTPPPVQTITIALDMSKAFNTINISTLIRKQSHTINPDKTTCTLFPPDPAEYKMKLGLNINNTALPMAMHPNSHSQYLSTSTQATSSVFQGWPL